MQKILTELLNSSSAKIIFEERSYSSQTLKLRVVQITSFIQKSGLKNHSLVACLPNSPELLCWQIACFLSGTVLISVIYEEPPEFIAQVLKLTNPDLLVTTSVRHASLPQDCIEKCAVEIIDSTFNLTVPDSNIKSMDAQTLKVNNVSPESLAYIVFSSGTSGNFKGIAHSQRSTQAFLISLSEVLSAEQGMEYLVAQPMGHIGGMMTALLTLSYDGTVILQEVFETDSFLAALQSYKPTHINLHTPLFYDRVDRPHLDRSGFSNLKICFAAGDDLAVDLPERFTKMTGAPMCTGYGLSEVGIVTVNTSPYGTRRGSIGKALSNMQIQIKTVSGDIAKVGNIGEIWVKSSAQCIGYLNMPELNKKTIVGSWFRTGDAAYQSADGDFCYVGRISSAIDYQGKTLFPSEVELLMYKSPLVNKAAVVVNQSQVSGAGKPVIFVEQSSQIDLPEPVVIAKLSEWIDQESQGRFSGMNIKLIKKMPLNMTGKINRIALKNEAAVDY